MDALKKAERARLARQDERGVSDSSTAQTLEFSLEAIESIDDTRGGLTGERAPAAEGSPAEASAEAAKSAPGAPIDFDLDIGVPPAPPAAPAPDTGRERTEDDAQPSSGEELELTVPSREEMREAVERYFDGTHSVSLSIEDLRTAMEDSREEASEPAAQAAPPAEEPVPPAVAGDGTTTTGRRIARTVLDAHAAGAGRRRKTRVLIGAGVLVLLLAVGAGFLYVYLTIASVGSPALVRRAPPRPPARARPADAAVRPAGVTSKARGASPAPVPKAAAAPVAPRGELGAAGAKTASKTPAPPSAIAGVASPPVSQVLTKPQASASPSEVAAQVASAIEHSRLTPFGTLDGRAIEVRREPVHDPAYPLLRRAFAAYRDGAFARAERDWERALRRRPNDRDALLGLAAVAMHEGRARHAETLYLRLLDRDPRDPAALAGLVGVRAPADPVAAESTVKTLITRDGGSGELYFTLGNLYARQGRWARAQEAYFHAYTRVSDDPDYVYNLAVSLDHIGQGEAALGFYRKALELAKHRRAGFPMASAAQRVRLLAAATPGR